MIFVGYRDPKDWVDPYGGRCEIVLVTQEAPPGWPYGPVPTPPTLRTAGTDRLR